MIIGKNIQTQKPFPINTKRMLQSHTFVNAITGSGKTGLILKIIESVQSTEFKQQFGQIPIIISDDQGEFLNVPKMYDDFILFENRGRYAEVFNLDNAKSVGEVARKDLVSMVIKLSDFASKEERERFLELFMEGYREQDRKYWNPALFIIDEADIYVPTTSKKKNSYSREAIIDACKRSRKENISIILATQSASSVHIDARRECTNRFVGNSVELSDRRIASQMLGEPSLVDKLWGLRVGQFYVRGEALCDVTTLIQVDRPMIKTPEVGVEQVNDHKDSVIEQYVVNRIEGDKRSLIQTYEDKIRKLEDEIKVLKTNQWTNEKQIMAYNEGKYDGRVQTIDEQKHRSFVNRVLNR